MGKSRCDRSVPRRRRDQRRGRAVIIGEQTPQILDLRQIVDEDVRISGVTGQEILIIILSRVEILVGLDLGDDRSIEYVHLVELGDIGLRDACLLRIGGRNRRAILAPDIGALPVELCRIVSDRKIDPQDPSIADQVGVEDDPTDSACPVVVVLTIS